MKDVVSAALGLSVSEKLHLIEVLWEDLDRRRAHLQEHPESALAWEQIVQDVRTRHGG